MPLYTKAWGLGRVALSYWAEQTHLFCLGTFEKSIFNWSGYTRLKAGYHIASMLEVEGRGVVCICVQWFLFPCQEMSAALPGVSMCITCV